MWKHVRMEMLRPRWQLHVPFFPYVQIDKFNQFSYTNPIAKFSDLQYALPTDPTHRLWLAPLTTSAALISQLALKSLQTEHYNSNSVDYGDMITSYSSYFF